MTKKTTPRVGEVPEREHDPEAFDDLPPISAGFVIVILSLLAVSIAILACWVVVR